MSEKDGAGAETPKGIDVDAVYAAADRASKEGSWVPFRDGAEVKIRYVSPDYMRDLNKRARKKKVWDSGTLTKVVDDDHLNELFLREVVVDWRGFTSKGKEIPFSVENLQKLMGAWTEFSKFVNDTCLEIQNFLGAQAEAESGN